MAARSIFQAPPRRRQILGADVTSIFPSPFGPTETTVDPSASTTVLPPELVNPGVTTTAPSSGGGGGGGYVAPSPVPRPAPAPAPTTATQAASAASWLLPLLVLGAVGAAGYLVLRRRRAA